MQFAIRYDGQVFVTDVEAIALQFEAQCALQGILHYRFASNGFLLGEAAYILTPSMPAAFVAAMTQAQTPLTRQLVTIYGFNYPMAFVAFNAVNAIVPISSLIPVSTD